MASKCIDARSSTLQYLIERYPALLIVTITCIPLYSFIARWNPSVRYKQLEVVYKDVIKFHTEGVKEGLLDDHPSSSISDELFILYVLLVSRYLEASKYKWFPKTMFLEFVGGISTDLFRCEIQFRDAHALLAARKADRLKKRLRDSAPKRSTAV